MNNDELAARFTDLVEPILGGAHTAKLLDARCRMESLDNVATLAELARPVEKAS
ncbi:hypothetical protein RI103_30225 [Paraburkholderia sp. FT54]|jgi:hypothetical protein|uniref:hypothetical protein n=1 Tax=Paraburkholderia sp. FT54 TaxID=3074437 RepID=UPI002877FFD3|nr:hypothetical protein [Paraburkholderia sp. FT54]WNC92536.1 hypothetical protein RI103_30225 [Paraburkholderia sp. FT54]